MNGRTFYAGEAGGSRVVLAAVPRLTPLGLYGHSYPCRPSRPAVRPRATLARLRKAWPPPGRVPTAYAVGLVRASHHAPSKPTGRKAAGESSTTRPPRGRGWRLPRHRLEPVGKLRIRPLAVKLRGGQAAGTLAIRGEAGAVGGEARDRLGKR